LDADLLGWLATLVLISTLSRQIWKQWKTPESQAVSGWLFLGQMTASVLFTIYSALMGSVVFVVTNSLILLTAVVGQVLSSIQRRRRSTTMSAREKAGLRDTP
jgi:uncharacterized protein with PQ loop repeat